MLMNIPNGLRNLRDTLIDNGRMRRSPDDGKIYVGDIWDNYILLSGQLPETDFAIFANALKDDLIRGLHEACQRKKFSYDEFLRMHIAALYTWKGQIAGKEFVDQNLHLYDNVGEAMITLFIRHGKFNRASLPVFADDNGYTLSVKHNDAITTRYRPIDENNFYTFGRDRWSMTCDNVGDTIYNMMLRSRPGVNGYTTGAEAFMMRDYRLNIGSPQDTRPLSNSAVEAIAQSIKTLRVKSRKQQSTRELMARKGECYRRFAELNGWDHIRVKAISDRMLRLKTKKLMNHDNPNGGSSMPGFENQDYAYFWQDGKPVGIGFSPYLGTLNLDAAKQTIPYGEMLKWADDNALKLTALAFPSGFWPERCIFCVLTRLDTEPRDLEV